MQRTSVVNNILIKGVSSSSIVHLGDSVLVKSRSRVLAVQRELAIFRENEGDFAKYPLFSKLIPQPRIDEQMNMTVNNENPFIKVNEISILGIAAASLCQIGSNQRIDLESRIKHFRQLLHGKVPRAGENSEV